MNPNEKQLAIELQLCRALLMACVAKLGAHGSRDSMAVADIVLEYLEASSTLPLDEEASRFIATIEQVKEKPIGEVN